MLLLSQFSNYCTVRPQKTSFLLAKPLIPLGPQSCLLLGHCWQGQIGALPQHVVKAFAPTDRCPRCLRYQLYFRFSAPNFVPVVVNVLYYCWYWKYNVWQQNISHLTARCSLPSLFSCDFGTFFLNNYILECVSWITKERTLFQFVNFEYSRIIWVPFKGTFVGSTVSETESNRRPRIRL